MIYRHSQKHFVSYVVGLSFNEVIDCIYSCPFPNETKSSDFMSERVVYVT